MRLCVVVDRKREPLSLCGECRFQNQAYDFCELFKQTTPRESDGDHLRINECFTSQRRGEDPTWREDGLEPRPARRE